MSGRRKPGMKTAMSPSTIALASGEMRRAQRSLFGRDPGSSAHPCFYEEGHRPMKSSHHLVSVAVAFGVLAGASEALALDQVQAQQCISQKRAANTWVGSQVGPIQALPNGVGWYAQ